MSDVVWASLVTGLITASGVIAQQFLSNRAQASRETRESQRLANERTHAEAEAKLDRDHQLEVIRVTAKAERDRDLALSREDNTQATRAHWRDRRLELHLAFTRSMVDAHQQARDVQRRLDFAASHELADRAETALQALRSTFTSLVDEGLVVSVYFGSQYMAEWDVDTLDNFLRQAEVDLAAVRDALDAQRPRPLLEELKRIVQQMEREFSEYRVYAAQTIGLVDPPEQDPE